MPRGKDNAQLIDAIYDAALDAGNWPRVLELCAQDFGSSSAHLSVDYLGVSRGEMISVGTDPDYMQRYEDYYAPRNVLWQRWLVRRPDGIMSDRTLMPKDELRRSEFYNDFLEPLGGEELLISPAWLQSDRANFLTLWRLERHGAWQPADMEALVALMPHLRRALQVNQRVGDLRAQRDLAGEALHGLEHGVILADAQARVSFANRAAEAMLADTGGLHLERHRLAARRIRDTAALRRLIADSAENGEGGSLVISREMRPALIVLVVPVKSKFCSLAREPRSAIVFIKDLERSPPPSLTAFAQYFGLTPAERAVAHETSKGDGVRAAATRLGISYATARTHLLRIFEKTGKGRQAELVHLMLEWDERPIVRRNGVTRSRTEREASIHPSGAGRRRT